VSGLPTPFATTFREVNQACDFTTQLGNWFSRRENCQKGALA
jgi:hypothetical protein